MHASKCRRRPLPGFAVFSVVLTLAANVHSVFAQTSLHERIDSAFVDVTFGPIAATVDDLTFTRRVYLDLHGRIPSVAESRAVIADTAEDRRRKLVDRLLDSDEFPRHMATVFDVMLMERRGGKHVKPDAFRAWLADGFRSGKPFHQLASELIAADTSNGQNTVAAFLLERDVEPNLLTREVSRMFFGRDVQCAQCHDHPNVDDYKQEDYYGLFAFLNRTSLFQPDKKKPALLSESADGQAPFKSVFTDRQAFTLARMPGEAEIREPVFAAGDEYVVRPAKTVAAVPKFSRRAKLAELVASGQNEYFRRNIANRLWAHMMGRGLVHPVDMHHSSNPPSHPAVMNLIASEFAAMNFDVRTFLRELALTDIYQRSHRIDDSAASQIDQLTQRIQQLESIEKSAQATSSAKEQEAATALDELDKVIATAEPLRTAWQKARSAATAAAGKRDTAVAAESSKKTALEQKKQIEAHVLAALQNIQSAAESLGGPEELTAQVKAFQARADKLKVESDKLQKEFDAATKASVAAVDTLQKANEKEKTERDKFTPVQETIRQHRTVLVKSFRDSQLAYELVSNAENQTEFLQSLIAEQNALTELPKTESALKATADQQQQASQQVAVADRTMETISKEMSTVSATRDSMQEEMERLSAEITRQQNVRDHLKESAAATNAALAMIDDPALKSVAATLSHSADRATEKMAAGKTTIDSTSQQLQAMQTKIEQLKQRLTAAQQQADEARKMGAKAAARLTELRQKRLEIQSTLSDAGATLTSGLTKQFQQATIESLSPEQLAWSILLLAGQIERQTTAALARRDKEKPLTDQQKNDPEQLAIRQKEAETMARVELEKQVATFVKLFGSESGQPQDSFFATVDQALFFANGSQIRSWLSPSGENLTGRLLKLESASQIAEELYLSALIRMPLQDEIRDVEQYLAARGNQKKEAVQELAWALITSAEFRFQY